MELDSKIENPDRLSAVAGSFLSDPAVEPALDRLTRLVCLAVRVPIALISLVEKDRQFFKSHCGLPEPWASRRETPLSHSFCKHVVVTEAPLLIEDATTDSRVLANLAIADLGVVAYAGVPIIAPDGHVLGSLCAIDSKPRTWSPADVNLLQSLSTQISADLAIRHQSAKLATELAAQCSRVRDRDTMLRLNVHDIRTPLSAMLLGLQMLDILGPLNEEQKEYLVISRRNGDAIVNMVNNLLDIGNIQEHGIAALTRKVCAPAYLVQAALDQSLMLAREKNQTVSSNVAEDVVDVFGDSDKLIRVIVNLLGNAIKFTQPGGKIDIAVEMAADQRRVEFRVSDNGIGMANVEPIFDDGVRLDKLATTARSTGLGLTFCKRIVEIHGGTLGVESVLGSGSTFRFMIPTAP